MLEIDAQKVKMLREKSGAGIMDCKAALKETGGDEEKAMEWLREKGMSTAAKKAGREAKEGIIDSYIHLGGKVGVLVEVNCETDFVAKNEEFRGFVHDLCLQVAASRPQYINREEVPGDLVEKEKDFIRKQALAEGKPEKVIDKIVEGRIEKFYQEHCLMDQAFVKDEDKSVSEVLTETIAKVGENVVIRRFVCFEVGEEA